jgi:hypothetical protein
MTTKWDRMKRAATELEAEVQALLETKGPWLLTRPGGISFRWQLENCQRQFHKVGFYVNHEDTVRATLVALAASHRLARLRPWINTFG